jgi:hypothetical protein
MKLKNILLETVARERLVKTQRAGKGLVGAAVCNCEEGFNKPNHQIYNPLLSVTSTPHM